MVIGNPPYVRQEALGDLKPLLKDSYEAYHGSADLFVYFIELGVKLLKKGGTFSYIVANKWMRANYGKPLRKWLKKQQLHTIIDYGDLPVFENATTYPCILFIGNESPSEAVNVVKMEELAFENLSAYVEEHGYDQPQAELIDSGWSLAGRDVQKVLDKLGKVGVPLEEYVDGRIYRGVVTGCNDVFVIDETTRTKLITEDPKSAEVIRPFFRGRDVKRWQVNFAEQYLLFIPWHFPLHDDSNISGASKKAESAFEAQYSAIYKYLLSHKEQLSSRNKTETGIRYEWYALQRCAASYWQEFDNPKIVLPAITQSASFAFDRTGAYSNDKTSIISVDDLYILGILNSKVSDLTIFSISSTKRGGYYEYKPMYVSQLPIRTIDFSNPADKAAHARMLELVDRMLSLHEQKADAAGDALSHLEAEILELDALVYELYGLSDEEIKIVEGSVS